MRRELHIVASRDRVGAGVAGLMGGDACVALVLYIRFTSFRHATTQAFVPLLVPLVGHCLTSYVGCEEAEGEITA